MTDGQAFGAYPGEEVVAVQGDAGLQGPIQASDLGVAAAYIQHNFMLLPSMCNSAPADLVETQSRPAARLRNA